MAMEPSSGTVNPKMQRRMVDLPEPERPVKVTLSLEARLIENRSTIVLPLNLTVRLSI
jgi:hypothetical protein